MPALGSNFDARAVQPLEPGAAIWEGYVPLQVMRTDIVPTASGDGSRQVVLHCKALFGRYANGDNVIRVQLYSTSAKAADYAQRQLSAICHVSGRLQITDSDQLVGAQFLTRWEAGVRQINDKDTGLPRNIDTCDCKEYLFTDGRTIKEAIAGQPAAKPFTADMASAELPPRQSAAQAPAPAPQAHAPAPFAPGAQQQPQQHQQQPGGFPQPGAPAPHAAPQIDPAGYAQAAGAVPGQGGMPQGFGTAASPSNGGFPGAGPGAPAAPGGGFPGAGAPQAQPGGFPGAGGQQPQQGGGFPGQQPGGFPGAGQQQQPQAQPGGFPGGGAPAAGAAAGPWGR